MLFKGLTRRFNLRPPAPSHLNVDPSGPGYYRYHWLKRRWRRVDVRGIDGRARWLSSNRLLELALDAAMAVRKAREGKR